LNFRFIAWVGFEQIGHGLNSRKSALRLKEVLAGFLVIFDDHERTTLVHNEQFVTGSKVCAARLEVEDVALGFRVGMWEAAAPSLTR